MVVINNEAIKEIAYQIESEGNPSSAGEYIYDYINNKNPHENLTLALRSIKEDLKEILSHYPDTFILGQVHYSILEEVIEKLGWEIDKDSFDFNGWEHDTSFDVLIKDKGIGYHVFCSWADPRILFKKFIISDEKSNNC